MTPEKSIQVCRMAELSSENSKTIQGQAVEEIHALIMDPKREKLDEKKKKIR